MTIQRLDECTAPFIILKAQTTDDVQWLPEILYKVDGKHLVARRLRGSKMRTKQALMDEMAAALQFFEGFGENWHAVKDCLISLREWMPADIYVIIISGAEDLLIEDEVALHWLLVTLHEVGEFWAVSIEDNDIFNRPAVPFRVVLQVSDDGKLREFQDRLGEDAALVEI